MGVSVSLGGDAKPVVGEDEQRQLRVESGFEVSAGDGELSFRKRDEIVKGEKSLMQQFIDHIGLFEGVRDAGVEQRLVAGLGGGCSRDLGETGLDRFPFRKDLGQHHQHRLRQGKTQRVDHQPLCLAVLVQHLG